MHVYCNFLLLTSRKNCSDPPLFLGWRRHWLQVIIEKGFFARSSAPNFPWRLRTDVSITIIIIYILYTSWARAFTTAQPPAPVSRRIEHPHNFNPSTTCPDQPPCPLAPLPRRNTHNFNPYTTCPGSSYLQSFSSVS